MYFDANNLYGDAMFRPHQKKRWQHIESCTPEQQKYTREKKYAKKSRKTFADTKRQKQLRGALLCIDVLPANGNEAQKGASSAGL